MPSIPPKLVNRGPAGLRDKAPAELPKTVVVVTPSVKINNISQDLRDKGMVVPIGSLVYDPDNARLHPERNIQSIKDSLNAYSQAKPVVVQKWTDAARAEADAAGIALVDYPQTNHVVTGNGTKQSAEEMGWTELAATFMDMTDAEAAGYGLADNRTAELAKWDFATVARLDKLVSDAGLSMAGWTMDELEVLRAADWTPPAIDESLFTTNGDGGEQGPLLVSFTVEQHQPVAHAVETIRQVLGNPEMDQAEALQYVCQDWLASKSVAT